MPCQENLELKFGMHSLSVHQFLAHPSYYAVFPPFLCFSPWVVSHVSGVAILRFCCKQSRHCNTRCFSAHGSLRWG
jgi:hypothetical protein